MNEPTDKEIRLRCIEAAAKSPIVHRDGAAAGVQEVATTWAAWVIEGTKKPGTLGVPKK
jgi:hypothetical protein